jgi:hypothetical protein
MVSQWESKINQPENFKMSAQAKRDYLEVLESQQTFLAGLNKGKPTTNTVLVLINL